MSPYFRPAAAARVRDIAPFQVMEVQTAARALEAAGRDVIHLEIGEPDFPTPPQVVAAAQAALAGGNVYYTSALGLPALREAIAGHYADRYGVRFILVGDVERAEHPAGLEKFASLPVAFKSGGTVVYRR